MVESESGETVTVAEGDALKGYGRIAKIDPYDGVVMIDTGTRTISLSYGVNGIDGFPSPGAFARAWVSGVPFSRSVFTRRKVPTQRRMRVFNVLVRERFCYGARYKPSPLPPRKKRSERGSKEKKSNIYALSIFILTITLISSGAVYAAAGTMPTAAEMLQNLAAQVPNLMLLVTAFAYIAGMFYL